MYALNLSEDNRILSATFEEYATADIPKVDTLTMLYRLKVKGTRKA